MSKYLDSNGLLYVWGKIKALLGGKVDKVEGKTLTSNDYTDAEKTKLAGVATGANKYTHPTGDGNAHVPATGTANGGKFLRAGATAGSAAWAGLEKVDVTGALGYTPPTTNTTYSPATASADGLMSKTDKEKLDGVSANANNYVHPTSAGNKHIPSGGANGQILRWSADGTATWGADNNTTYGPMTGATASAAGTQGLVPAPAAGAQVKYLRGDGTWVTPTNTTYSAMTGATADAAGKQGLVPAPAAGTQAKYLRGDGTWQTPPNTTYGVATASTNGLMAAADKVKLDAFGSASTYALKSEIANVYRWKGSKTSQGDLPSTGNTVGDVWNVEATGMNYGWTGTSWDALGAVFEVVAITNADIDAICV